MEHNEITILYPLRDSQSLVNADHIWVSSFKEYFEASLHQLIDKRISIKEFAVGSGNNLSPELATTEGIYISLITPDFIQIGHYVRLLEQIYEIQKNRKTSILFHVLKFPVSDDNMPDWLQYQPQYAFYDKKPNTRKIIELDFSHDINEKHVFWHRLTDLVYDIYESITMHQHDNELLNRNYQYQIFVAETTPDQEENRNKIIRELKQQGYNVLPKHRFSNRSKEIEPILKEILDQCIMSIHILGRLYGAYLKDTRYSITDYLNRFVRDFINEKGTDNQTIKRIIWIPPYLKISDQRQDLFLGRLKREESDPNTELVQSPLEDLKTLIIRNINALTNTLITENEKTNSIYIIYDPLSTSNIENYLTFFQEKAISVLTLDFDQTNNIIEQHLNIIKSCDSVLVVYNGNQNWLEAKLRDIIKIKGYGRKHPFVFKAIVTETENQLNHLERKLMDEFILIEYTDDFSLMFEPLLTKLEKNHA